MRNIAQTKYTEGGSLEGRGGSILCPKWLRNMAEVVYFLGCNHQDVCAVMAIETDWSNGPVEGQVNRLKTIKRMMYGRAGFQVLRNRVLYQW